MPLTLWDGVRRLGCSLRGHESLLQFERNRVFLRCVACGHESPGWETGPDARALREPARRTAIGSQLVRARRPA
jgi:hypothetical protein